MKTAMERAFIRCGQSGRTMADDGLVRLRPREYLHRSRQLDGAVLMTFDVLDAATGRVAGEISLRIGEGRGLFYLGHIGYHIDPPFRGRHAALHACRLCVPILDGMGMGSFVITTDEDNVPSIRTAMALGCRLESTVDVPLWCRQEYGISARKRRYVFEIRHKMR